jgi:hypothetical protein
VNRFTLANKRRAAPIRARLAPHLNAPSIDRGTVHAETIRLAETYFARDLGQQPSISAGFESATKIARCAGLARGFIVTRVDDRTAT